MQRVEAFSRLPGRGEPDTSPRKEAGKVTQPIFAVAQQGSRLAVDVLLEQPQPAEALPVAERSQGHRLARLLIAAETGVAGYFAVRLSVPDLAGLRLVARHERQRITVEQVIGRPFQGVLPQCREDPRPENRALVVDHGHERTAVPALCYCRQRVRQVVRGHDAVLRASAQGLLDDPRHGGVLGVTRRIRAAEG